MHFIQLTRRLFVAIGLSFALVQCAMAERESPEYSKDVAPILAKYCSGCHNDSDLDGDLSLVSFAKLQKGGEKGAVIVPGRADASLLLRMVQGDVEPKMPPEDNPQPSAAEIATIRAWIDAGARGPAGEQSDYPELATPKIKPVAGVHSYLTSMALSPDGKQLALGRFRHVEIVDAATGKSIATTKELPGKVNNVCYSADGKTFVAASGIAGLYGVATICNSLDGSTVAQIKGHKDSLYDAALDPTGTLLATCSYDRDVNLWTVPAGKLVRALTGHNGAVYDVEFSKDGEVLASASAHATVKLWKGKTGERLDTLGQPESEQCAVGFSRDSGAVVAGGGDRQLRLWQFVSREAQEINPLKFSRTAHDSSIVKLAFSPKGSKLVTASEGRELVLWDVAELTPVYRFEMQPDVVTGLAFEPSGQGFYVARMDGSWKHYSLPLEDKKVADSADQSSDTAADQIAMEEKKPQAELAEQEPNNAPAAANAVAVNSVVKGVIGVAEKGGEADADLYRVHAKQGEKLVFEIKAASDKSPLDSKLEVLDAAGKSIARVVLQAVRTSYMTFRGHNSTDLNDFRLHGAGDMEFNEYLYANGEVMKLWLNPRGPDSGFVVYPGYSGKRFTYFGTSGITHSLNETCYIVEPHEPDERPIPNGLPQYTLYYENDDDERRKMGTDSRIAFTAPADGDYLVRVSDVRGQGGEAYKYQLSVHPPRPGFIVSMAEKDRTVNAGSGKEFAAIVTRKDEFDGEVKIEFKHLPPGFHVTSPLTIQAGQTTAYGVLSADADAPALTAENGKKTKVVASAVVNGKLVKQKPLEFGEIKLGDKPKLLISVLPDRRGQAKAAVMSAPGDKPVELFISPGQTIAATVKIERNGFDGDATFGTEFAGRNLPHGVYVDNIGLNGVTLLRGENERTIFLTARKWVPEQTRLFHLRAGQEGNQTSMPVILHVRKGTSESSPKASSVASSPETK